MAAADAKGDPLAGNKFVAAFTDPERTALKQLRDRLPLLTARLPPDAGEEKTNAARADAPPLPPPPSTPPTQQLWGVPLVADSTDPRLDVILVKFLRARSLNVDATADMLTAALAWREKFGVAAILDERFPEDVFRDVGYIHKTDRDGRPVCFNAYGNLAPEVFADVDRFIRWRVQLMEKGIRQGVDFVNADSMVQVHDYAGASFFFGRTPQSKEATNRVIQLMQDNYPEFLAKKYFVNLPWWAPAVFKLIRPMLPEATVKKFVICSASEATEALLQSIPEENLPTRYGGKSVVEGASDPAAGSAPSGKGQDAVVPAPVDAPTEGGPSEGAGGKAASAVQASGKVAAGAAAPNETVEGEKDAPNVLPPASEATARVSDAPDASRETNEQPKQQAGKEAQDATSGGDSVRAA